jgi:hypothetical protein
MDKAILGAPRQERTPVAKTDRPFTYAYLSSAGHSGSTLLACLLNAHPEVCSVGEFASPKPTHECSCGCTFETCPFWHRWRAEARKEGFDLEAGKLDIFLEPHPQGGFTEDLFYYLFPGYPVNRLRDAAFSLFSHRPGEVRRALDKAIALARILCRIEKTSVFFDTSKSPFWVRFLGQFVRNIPIKVIALVRDGRGVMNSLIRKEHYTPDYAIAHWLWSNRNLRRATRYLPASDVIWLRLEDFCRAPQDKLREIFRFLGVDENGSLALQDRKTRHIIGNKMRHTFNGEIRHDESWRQELSREHLRLFEERAGWLNRCLGYDA